MDEKNASLMKAELMKRIVFN